MNEGFHATGNLIGNMNRGYSNVCKAGNCLDKVTLQKRLWVVRFSGEREVACDQALSFVSWRQGETQGAQTICVEI